MAVPEKKLDLPTITGFQHIATVDRFVLDEGERKLVLQGIFRVSLLSINCIARDFHDPIISSEQYNSRPLEYKKRMNIQSTMLPERTYTALPQYGASSELDV